MRLLQERRRAHLPGRESIDRLLLSGIGHGLRKFRDARDGTAGRINIEEDRFHVWAGRGFTHRRRQFLCVGCAEEDLREDVRLANQRAGYVDDAHAVLDIQERRSFRARERRWRGGEGLNRKRHGAQCIRRNQPRLTQENRFGEGHAEGGVSNRAVVKQKQFSSDIAPNQVLSRPIVRFLTLLPYGLVQLST